MTTRIDLRNVEPMETNYFEDVDKYADTRWWDVLVLIGLIAFTGVFFLAVFVITVFHWGVQL